VISWRIAACRSPVGLPPERFVSGFAGEPYRVNYHPVALPDSEKQLTFAAVFRTNLKEGQRTPLFCLFY
jgi:hypothetical protein